jgi:hypothetical protein
MTRPLEQRHLVLELHAQGLNNCEIARFSGIPRSTLRQWLKPGVPRLPAGPSCEFCGHHPHDFEALPAAEYAYLLGLYLGDGCISAGRKRVYRLRISMDTKYPGIIAECAHAMKAVLPASAVHVQYHKTARLAEIGSSSRAWPCYIPQHGPGPKASAPDCARALAGGDRRATRGGVLARAGAFGRLPLHKPRLRQVLLRTCASAGAPQTRTGAGRHRAATAACNSAASTTGLRHRALPTVRRAAPHVRLRA